MEPAMRLVLCLVLACVVGTAGASTQPKATLKPFASEREWGELLSRWRESALALPERRRLESLGGLAMNVAPAAAPQSMAKAAADSSAAAESITNVQTAGVDEGGIVKRVGDHLVILRRGRLFTVRVGGEQLKPVAMLNAYAPGSDPSGAWYDELLIHERTVVVVGYSYARGGTEIGLFELGDDGQLSYRATHHLKSHDYYSSRNYASRLVGSKLVFYTPSQINAWALQPEQFMPQWRRWNAATPDPSNNGWQRILPATRIYRSDDDIDPMTGGAALHTVTSCDLARPAQMRCESSAVLAPPGRVFYVSAGSVYVWTTEWQRRPTTAMPMARSAVFRLPLDGAAPSMLKTTGAPIDQLSFLEDDAGHLNVLLRANARGEGMWNAERSAGDLALMRVALSSFGSGSESAPRSAYRPLPALPNSSGTGALQNRFVGDWLLYGTPSGSAGEHAVALRYAASADAQTLALGHGVLRIEALGRDAVLIGNAGRDLHFTSLRLAENEARVAGSHVQRDATQGETRTHGFFYRATAQDEGVIGLPVIGGAAQATTRGRRADSASVLFVRNRALSLNPVGELQSSSSPAGNGRDDQCQASCVDWYGNARPIFLGERVFALLGYELVEGRMARRAWSGERIEELRRISFAPQPSSVWGRD
jgi:Beta propeller domain